MAKMYPENLTRHDTLSSAEKQLFLSFKKNLDNDYIVYHSVHWTQNTNTPREIDFVIMHRQKGFVVLEVKGGEILINNGDWFSISRDGKKHSIQNPFRQAERSLYFLLDFYQKQYNKRFAGLATYAVCFPDTVGINQKLHPEITHENILFHHNLENPIPWLNRLYAEPFYNKYSRAMDLQTIDNFHNILKPTLTIPLSLHACILQQQEEIRQIDFVQDYLLDIFDDKNKVAIQGAAGTGKTWIALKKMVRLVQNNKNCLFLCYNHLLSTQLQENFSTMLAEDDKTQDLRGRADIFTFHAFANFIFERYIESIFATEHEKQTFFSFCCKALNVQISTIREFFGILSSQEIALSALKKHALYKTQDVRVLQLLDILLEDTNDGYFDFNVPMALLTLLDDNSSIIGTYDAIIIDEGQDFKKIWCDCLAYFFKSKRKRIVYLFYDENQNIFMRKKNLPIIELIDKYNVNPYLYKLKKNIRNTRAIYNYATEKTNLGKTAQALAIQGINPFYIKVATPQLALKEISKILADLIVAHNIKNEQIVVLSDISVPDLNSNLTSNSIFSLGKTVGNYKLTKDGKGTTGAYIKLRSVRRFKGLEADVVILVLHQNYNLEDLSSELLYVAYTRAKFLLYVIDLSTDELTHKTQ